MDDAIIPLYMCEMSWDMRPRTESLHCGGAANAMFLILPARCLSYAATCARQLALSSRRTNGYPFRFDCCP